MQGPFTFRGKFEVRDGHGKKIATTVAKLYQLDQLTLCRVQRSMLKQQDELLAQGEEFAAAKVAREQHSAQADGSTVRHRV